MSHTPGPWRAVQEALHTLGDYDVMAAGGRFVAACGHADVAKENAQLIAAAPDLLAALYGLVELSSFTDALYALAAHDPEESQRKQRMANALTAIAKAEGR